MPRATVETTPLGSTFLRIWASQTISTIGSTIAVVGVAISVYLQTGNAAWLGAISAMTALPILLVSPLLARLDRLPRRMTMIAADCGAALGPAMALTISIVGDLRPWHLVVAAFLGGAGISVQVPVANAIVPSLVKPDALGRANGLFQLGPAAGIVLGPAIAAPLVAWYGVTAVLVVDVASFLFAVATTLLTPFDDATCAPISSDDGSWRSAWSWLRVNGRPLLVLLGAMSFVNFALEFYNLSLIALATDLGGAARSGLALAAGGFAMVMASLVLGRTGTPRRPALSFAIGFGVACLGCIVTAARPSFVLVVFGVVVALIPLPILNAGASTLFHERVPAAMHGRVFALRSTLSRALDPVGAVVAGFVLARVAGPTMQAGGLGAESVGRLIGTGEHRGPALVMLATGVALGVLAVIMRASRSLRSLDDPVTGHVEHDVDVPAGDAPAGDAPAGAVAFGADRGRADDLAAAAVDRYRAELDAADRADGDAAFVTAV